MANWRLQFVYKSIKIHFEHPSPLNPSPMPSAAFQTLTSLFLLPSNLLQLPTRQDRSLAVSLIQSSTPVLPSAAASRPYAAPPRCPYNASCSPPRAAAEAAPREEVLSPPLLCYWEVAPHVNFGYKILHLITYLQSLLIYQCYIFRATIRIL